MPKASNSHDGYEMAKPSLKASSKGIQTAKQALTIAGIAQKDLCQSVGCSRQPITNFFQGKAISQDIFLKICDRLNLNWQEIAGLEMPKTAIAKTPIVKNPEREEIADSVNDPETLVVKLRKRVHTSIREQCGTMRILDMSYPIEVDEIYTNVNILEKITGRKYKTIEQLLQGYELAEFDRIGLGKIAEKRIPGIAAVKKYQKLIILGKPGAGKTTFLKYLAIQCNEGYFETERVPIFVNLKNFAESPDKLGLLEYISQKAANFYLPIPTTNDVEQYLRDFSRILYDGKALVLLDGLDEVRGEDSDRILQQIRDLSQQFRNNHFVMTCRIAAWEYNFEKFTEVEVADFDEGQIEIFAKKWFKQKQIKARTFLKHLAQNSRIKQLTVSPLLLTLVCLAFEESGDCPNSRSELYKEGIDALLKKWDSSRGIQRDRVYQQLSHQRKEDLLGKLALTTFTNKDYFFKKSFVEQFIAGYIRNLPHANSEPAELLSDSEAILNSIEAQHGLLIERAKGIYSFSHLTFHEYFTAREIVFNRSSLDTALKELMSRVSDRRWREIFLLTAEILGDASLLLLPMADYLAKLTDRSENFQAFLVSVSDLAIQLQDSGIRLSALRAFYFDVDFEIDENRTVALQLDKSANYLVCASFLTRMLDGVDLAKAIAISQEYDLAISNPEAKIIAAKSANTVMLIAISIALNSEKLQTKEKEKLQTLVQKSQTQTANEEVTKEIADRARESAKTRHQIGKIDNLASETKKLQQEYYYVACLLVECLNSEGCMLCPELRQKINDNLFV